MVGVYGAESGPPPLLEELTPLYSAPVPGGHHAVFARDSPTDHSLYQYFLDTDGELLDSAAPRVDPTDFRRAQSGDRVGVGILLGELPPDLSFVRHTHSPERLDLHFTGSPGSAAGYVLSLYHRVWPGTPVEVEALSMMTGRFSTELIARLELIHDGQPYVLGTFRRVPTVRNALEYAQLGVRAHMFSHTEGVDLGRTLRFVHDSLLMAFPHEWVPADQPMSRLEERLDRFVDHTPALRAHAAWIREWYRGITGEILVQRLHGNLDLAHLWLGEGDRWIIGGWEGDLSLPLPERARLGCPLEDLASLQHSLFRVCGDQRAWCVQAMTAVFEGYGEPAESALQAAYMIDRTCADLARDRSGSTCALDFLVWFREHVLPHRAQLETSGFYRESGCRV